MNILIKAVLVISGLVLSGCGGGGDDGSSQTPTTATVTGQFIDAPVQGLKYACSSGKTDKTNSQGEYTCNVGDNVTFSIGSSVIGTVAAQIGIITPYSLFPNDTQAAINFARLLQSMDTSASDNLIILDEILEARLTNNINFRNASFQTEIETLLGLILVSEESAKNNMNNAIVSAGGNVPTDTNRIPVSNAGADQNVNTTSQVILDGSASSDADQDQLTYSWSITSKPSGSNATLLDSTVVNPTFTADLDGSYVFSLTVNDGAVDSVADTITVTATTANSAPVATYSQLFLEEDQNVSGYLSALDDDGDSLKYFKIRDSTHGVLIVDINGSFQYTPHPNYYGQDSFSYKVNDGQDDSLIQEVTITIKSIEDKPIANAGTNQTVSTSKIVQLDGSMSYDSDGNQLSYLWNIISRPSDSIANIDTSSEINSTFVADKDGEYIIELIVSDGVSSSSSTVMISAINTAPRFINSSSHFNVSENNTRIGQVLVTDDNMGDVISYQIVGDNAELFEIDQNGTVSFLTPLNYTLNPEVITEAVVYEGYPMGSIYVHQNNLFMITDKDLKVFDITDLRNPKIKKSFNINNFIPKKLKHFKGLDDLYLLTNEGVYFINPTAPDELNIIQNNLNFINATDFTYEYKYNGILVALSEGSNEQNVLYLNSNKIYELNSMNRVYQITTNGIQFFKSGAGGGSQLTMSFNSNTNSYQYSWPIISEKFSTCVFGNLEYFSSFLYQTCASGETEFYIYKPLGDLGSHEKIATYPLDSYYQSGLYIDEYYAYIPHANKLEIIDITNKYTPILESAAMIDSTAFDVDVKKNIAYVATYKGFKIIRLSGYDVTIEVQDQYGNASTKTFDVSIDHNNATPIARAGDDQNIFQGTEVILDGSKSSDTDGIITDYLWQEGNTTLSTNSRFTKSDFIVGRHLITLTVFDNNGSTHTDKVYVTCNADGVYIDDNGIMWQDQELGNIRSEYNASYCSDLVLGGFDDWEMPNIYQLRNLFREKENLLTDFKSYWSSDISDSKCINSNQYANSIIFDDGSTYIGCAQYYTRCKREGYINLTK